MHPAVLEYHSLLAELQTKERQLAGLSNRLTTPTGTDPITIGHLMQQQGVLETAVSQIKARLAPYIADGAPPL